RLLELGRAGVVLALVARQFFDYAFSLFSECGLALFEGSNLILKAFYPLCRLLPLEFNFGVTRKALAQRLLRFGHLSAALMYERVQTLDLRFKAAARIANRGQVKFHIFLLLNEH